jgi:hypothetical protein
MQIVPRLASTQSWSEAHEKVVRAKSQLFCPEIVISQKQLWITLHIGAAQLSPVLFVHTSGVLVGVLVGVFVGVRVGVGVGVRVAVGAGVQRRGLPGPATWHTRPAQHCWFPWQGDPAGRQLGAAVLRPPSDPARPTVPRTAAPAVASRVRSARRRLWGEANNRARSSKRSPSTEAPPSNVRNADAGQRPHCATPSSSSSRGRLAHPPALRRPNLPSTG